MDGRRTRYVPLGVYFAHGATGTRLLKRFGHAGLLVWVCLLAAAKRADIEGTLTYASDGEAWLALGLLEHRPEFTLDTFFTYTGQLKQTRKTRSGQLKHVKITRWEDWNKTWRTELEAEKKSRKRGTNTRTLTGHYPDNTKQLGGTEVEVEVEVEDIKRKAVNALRVERNGPEFSIFERSPAEGDAEMRTRPEELGEQLKRMRFDLTALQGKLTEALRMSANLTPVERLDGYRCPHCGVVKNTEVGLANHIANVHETASDFHRKDGK